MFCGIDWSEQHHDVAIVDDTGVLVAKRRISDDLHGWRQLLQLLAEAGDKAEEPIPVAIETPRGLLVSCLRAERSTPSIRWRWPATANGASSHEPSPTTPTP
jgi:transposase